MTDRPNQPNQPNPARGAAIRQAYLQGTMSTLVAEGGKCCLRDTDNSPQAADVEEWLEKVLAEADRLGIDTTGEDWQAQIKEIAGQLSPEKRGELFFTPPAHVVIEQ